MTPPVVWHVRPGRGPAADQQRVRLHRAGVLADAEGGRSSGRRTVRPAAGVWPPRARFLVVSNVRSRTRPSPFQERSPTACCLVFARGLSRALGLAALGLLLLTTAAAAAGGAEGAGESRAAADSEARKLLEPGERLRVGIGSRVSVERDGEWRSLHQEARRRGVQPDFVQLWLTRGWSADWVRHQSLVELAEQGVTPVVVHYFYGDFISKERIETQRDPWYASMWRMANLVRMDHPVLVILEPEWNIAAPPGETNVTEWPWFANDLRAAAEMIREVAPNALVGTCPGDFPGPPKLEPVLSPVADDLDFLAFQEMRGSTAPDASEPGYRDVAGASVQFARYLQRAFGRPLLLGYLAFSSHGGWETAQATALRDLYHRRQDLLDAGVFGWVYFHLFDDPDHEGYFGPAERSFGLLRADGEPKPAFEVFRGFFPAPAQPGPP